MKVYDYFIEKGSSYLVTEFLNGQNLSDYISSKGPINSENEISKIMKDILKGLAAIYEENIAVRDLKTENIMYT